MRLRVEGRAGPEGWMTGCGAWTRCEGRGESWKLLESLRGLARLAFEQITDSQCVGCSEEPDLRLHSPGKASSSSLPGQTSSPWRSFRWLVLVSTVW